ncbi:MAG: transcriptional regulator, IclR family, partial [Tardiphaga sp.]|nr:transcriptional regulator, IclR family [Tardiphaga sp.]
ARRILSANLGVGSRLPAYVVSLGRVLLAALPDEQRAHYLATTDFKAITPRTTVDPDVLAEQLQRADAQGYAWIDGELDPAICGIAVPVRDQGGRVVAAVSINTISGTIDEAEAKAKFLVALRRTAQDIRTQTAG